MILDEPTIGLDVLSKQRLREFLIAERRERGTTLLLTTHDMGDIERLCERVLVVDHGRLAYDGTLGGLSTAVGAERVLTVDLDRPEPGLPTPPGTRAVGVQAGGLRHVFAFDTTGVTVGAVLADIARHAEIRDLTIAEPDIEDVVRRLYRSHRRP
ncbi:ABC-2 type transport system ATP-binding protein [Gordonia amarae]|uniref:Putative ABC transporter ATP-binding protein n=1 Tax=Gordonia amarae NBRC 15530 TaxID=1075090 RepID=G7GL55_9ACTN|nr:hypothetical protein [Gordonia amarae]MCS3878856.1 ABC-2 type transport system ATP-binding protein [Gordonia amarae]GAB04330.1 putative ABC transporter ATP-binding protein [Gordonia amarae NBRC 15530]